MKTKRFFIISLFISIIFFSCDSFHDFSYDNTTVPEGKACINISVNDTYSRTALPVFDWDDFTYELIAVQNPGEATQKDPQTLFSERYYEQLVKGITLDVGKYKFTLNAYRNSKKVLSGTQTVDLSSGNISLSFLMYSVSGEKGSAIVKLVYPMESPVTKVVAYTSDSIFEEKSGVELTNKIVSGKLESSYEVSNLDSNKEQYAIIKFYDANNTLVYSCAESLIIVGGCVSKSTIEVTNEDWHTYICTVTLKKDREGWASSGKTVSLVNKTNSSKVYELLDSAGGKFKASVAEGIYYVYVDGESTGVEFNSINKNIDVNYYSVSMDPVKKCTMIPVSGGIAHIENLAIVQDGKSFAYKLSLSRGYEVSSFVVKQNSNVVSGADFDVPLTIETVTEPVKITTEGIAPIVYSIKYIDIVDNSEIDLQPEKVTKYAYWYKYGGTYTPPETFTAEETVLLPTIDNIRKDNNYFDAWTDSNGKTIIDTENVYENIVVHANWRGAPKADDENKVIYANGFNLLIKGKDTKNSQTYIYIDYNGNGVVDGDDKQITCKNITTGANNDFTGYELRAGSEDGSFVPKSDFIFTMTGGNIAAIYGLNSRTQKYSNKSTVKISGTAIIGNIGEKTVVTNPDSTTSTYASSVKGVMLDTLSAERVFIVAQMTNLTDTVKTPYSVTCVTENNYELDREHIVAEIANSNFATLANFTCWNVNNEDPDNVKYKQILLSHKEEIVNSVTRTYIRMADDSGVVLPKSDEIIWDDVNNEFNLGSDSIQKPCSVFSLSVENGTFRVNERTTITNNKTDADLRVEKTLTYMAQPTPLTYVEKLSFDESYVYMQVMSSADLLTPRIINDFLTQVFFKKIDSTQPIKVTMNIETVPAKFIFGSGDGHGGSEYKYFNGSFYKRFQYDNEESIIVNGVEKDKDLNIDMAKVYNKVGLLKGLDKGKSVYLINWTNSYNKAKCKSFNGLKGYLMNITSEVENNYIYDTYFKLNPNQLSWAGGAAIKPAMTTTGMLTGQTVSCWDQDTSSLLADNTAVTETTALDKKRNTDKWYWQAGPEAGMCFWGTPVIQNQADADNGAANRDCDFDRWNNSEFLHNDSSIYDSNENFDDPVAPGVLLRGRLCQEPNSKGDHTIDGVKFRGTTEQYLQFLAGELDTDTGNYRANGFWNNQGDANNQTNGFGCTGYIVEFTPYETEYGRQVANYQAIKRTSYY